MQGTGLTTIQLIALIASAVAILSLSLNFVLWRSRAALTRSMRSQAQSAFNNFHQITRSADAIRGLDRVQAPPDKKLVVAVRQAHAINGVTNAARVGVMAFAREHLKFTPVVEELPSTTSPTRAESAARPEPPPAPSATPAGKASE